MDLILNSCYRMWSSVVQAIPFLQGETSNFLPTWYRYSQRECELGWRQEEKYQSSFLIILHKVDRTLNPDNRPRLPNHLFSTSFKNINIVKDHRYLVFHQLCFSPISHSCSPVCGQSLVPKFSRVLSVNYLPCFLTKFSSGIPFSCALLCLPKSMNTHLSSFHQPMASFRLTYFSFINYDHREVSIDIQKKSTSVDQLFLMKNM